MQKPDMTFFDWWLKNSIRYKAILFDVDGTLISGPQLMPGADRMISWLREHHYPFALLTNDGNHSPQEKSNLLQRCKLDIAPEEIVSCSMALNKYVDDNNLHGASFFVMGDLGKPCYAENAGLKPIRDIEQIEQCQGIIVGEGFYDWHKNFHAVLNLLRANPQIPFIVPNPDSYWPDSRRPGFVGIGAGGKARFICTILNEMGLAVTPHYLGKPYQDIYDYTIDVLKKRFDLDDELASNEVIMLGDSLKSDIQGANNVGMHSALVLTGITNQQQATDATGDLKPDFIFKSIC
ncbi:MAG: HAD-IIA family hydrolase [Victivallaceae bacterium]|nr:HAD-IIA family hydrolase [Victivallaceae bacterium]